MNVSLKSDTACRKTLTVEVPQEELASERAELLNYYATGVSVPGFRKGKAPKALVEKRFAKEMAQDLKDRLVPKYYHEAIEKEAVKVVSIINVSEPVVDADKPFSFEVIMDVVPEFKLPKYKGIALKAEATDVADAEVESTVDGILRQHITYNDIEGRAAVAKDMVQVSYESTIDGEPLEDKVPEARGMGKGNGYWITCDEESFLPGMGEALVGTSIGDTKEVEVIFPSEFIVKELTDVKAVFKVEVTGMRESVMPTFDEEFLAKLQVESEAELRTNVRSHLEDAAMNKEKNRQSDALCEFLLKKTELEVPESAVKDQTRNVMYDMARQRMSAGASQEQIGAEQEDMMKEAAEKAVDQVKLRYIMFDIADAEEITADDAEVDEEITRMAVQQGRDAADMRKELEKNENVEAVRDQLRFGKTVEFLLENAKIK